MLMNREQLALNLSYLAKDDYSLINDIIIDYVMNHIDNNRFNDLEDYVNNEMRSLVWEMLSFTANLHCYQPSKI